MPYNEKTRLVHSILNDSVSFYSATQASKILGVCNSTIIRWCKAGKLESTYIEKCPFAGPRYKINKNQVDEIARQMVKALDDSGWLSADAACKLLGITHHKLTPILNNGDILAVNLPYGDRNTWRINKQSLSAYKSKMSLEKKINRRLGKNEG